MASDWTGPALDKLALDREELREKVSLWQSTGDRVVLTNGTFDILHVGHVRALLQARAAGDRLVVALNSDASVRRYKGEARPLVPEMERAELIAAIGCVDLVTLFDEDTASPLLLALRPDVYAKGRDYADAELPETRTAREVGATIAFVGDEKTHGASDVIERVRHLVADGRL